MILLTLFVLAMNLTFPRVSFWTCDWSSFKPAWISAGISQRAVLFDIVSREKVSVFTHKSDVFSQRFSRNVRPASPLSTPLTPPSLAGALFFFLFFLKGPHAVQWLSQWQDLSGGPSDGVRRGQLQSPAAGAANPHFLSRRPPAPKG